MCYQKSFEHFYIFEWKEKLLDVYDESFKLVQDIKVGFDVS